MKVLKKLTIWAVIVFILSFSGNVGSNKVRAASNSRYVSTSGVDSGDCSASSCKTLAYVASKSASGDTIRVSAGSYQVPAFDKALNWQGDSAFGEVIFDGSATSGGSFIKTSNIHFQNIKFINNFGTGVKVLNIDKNLDNITFANCWVSGPGTNAYGVNLQEATTKVKFENTLFNGSYYFIFNEEAGSGFGGPLEVTNCTFNLDAATLILNLPYASTLAHFSDGSLILHSGGSSLGLFKISGNGGLTLENFNPITIYSSSPLLNFPTSGTNGAVNISGNTINYPGPGLVDRIISVYPQSGSSGHNILISGNSITTDLAPANLNDNGIIYIKDQTGSIEIKNNAVTTTTTANRPHIRIFNTNSTASPSKILISGNNLKTKSGANYLVILGLDGSDSKNDGRFNNAVIEQNRAFGPGYFNSSISGIHGFIVGHSIKAHFRDNYINGFEYGIIFKTNGLDFQNIGGAYYNVFVNNTNSDVYIKGTANVPVYNNIFYLGTGKTVSQGMLNIGANGSYNSSGAWVRNNIFLSNNNAGWYQKMIFAEDGSTTGFTSSSNIFFNPNGNLVFHWGLDNPVGLSSWQTASGQDQTSRSVDLGFNNILYLENEQNLNNLYLNSNSPAIAAGESLPVNFDYNGQVQYKDFLGMAIANVQWPTIGAVEYVVDTIRPVITVFSPKDRYLTYGSYVYISGQITDAGSGVASATLVGGSNLTLDSNGYFTQRANLKIGTNYLTITAVDRAGNQTTKTIIVGRRAAVPIPLGPLGS